MAGLLARRPSLTLTIPRTDARLERPPECRDSFSSTGNQKCQGPPPRALPYTEPGEGRADGQASKSEPLHLLLNPLQQRVGPRHTTGLRSAAPVSSSVTGEVAAFTKNGGYMLIRSSALCPELYSRGSYAILGPSGRERMGRLTGGSTVKSGHGTPCVCHPCV